MLGADSPQLWSEVQAWEGRQACPLRDAELGMGAHEPAKGSAHSRRCASLREGFHRRPGDLCSSIRARHKSCFATACWGALRSVGPSGQLAGARFRVDGSLDLEAGLGWGLEFHSICRGGPFLEPQVCHPINL